MPPRAFSAFSVLEEDFEWLDDLDDYYCYTPFAWENLARTTDFGLDGHTASVTDWHELLQITAPDPLCGLVYVRGAFPDIPDAILARAQRVDHNGKKGTWGIQALPHDRNSDFELGVAEAQGLINSNWPYMRYPLKLKTSSSLGFSQLEPGIFAICSFVKDGTVFQVVRLKAGTFEGQTPKHLLLSMQVGGRVRFGCPCVSDLKSSDNLDTYTVAYKDGTSSCHSRLYRRRLDMRIFINGEEYHFTHGNANEKASTNDPEETPSKLSGPNSNHKYGDISVKVPLCLKTGDAMSLVVAYSLRGTPTPEESNTELKEDLAKDLPHVSSPVKLMDILGIADKDGNLKELWAACWTADDGDDEDGEKDELRAIARCVEQVLSLSSIPITVVGDTEAPDPKHCRAVISNIMTTQIVDLKSAFWQVRLLVKAHNFLENSKLDGGSLQETRHAYLQRIRTHIQLVLLWVVRAKYESPGFGYFRVGVSRDHVPTNRNLPSSSTYYSTMTIWYIMKHCPKALNPALEKELLPDYVSRNQGNCKSQNLKTRKPKKDLDVDLVDGLLKWYHAICLSQIQASLDQLKNAAVAQATIDVESEFASAEKFSAADTERVPHQQPDIQETSESTGGASSPSQPPSQNLSKKPNDQHLESDHFSDELLENLRKLMGQHISFPPDSYSAEDETVDRLALLADELVFTLGVPKKDADFAKNSAKQAAKKVLKRERTRTFNPGVAETKSGQARIHAPWELTCLNHHSLLHLGSEMPKEVDVEIVKQNCFQFLSSDHSFLASWDRSRKNMFGEWWDYEVSSIICSTLISLRAKELQIAEETESKLKILDSRLTQLELPEVKQLDTRVVAALIKKQGSEEDIISRLFEKIDRQILLQKDMIDVFKKRKRALTEFEWTEAKPDKIYHPDSWTQSLDDTPEVFEEKSDFSKELEPYVNINKHLKNMEELPENFLQRKWNLARVEENITGSDVSFLSFFDISLDESNRLALIRKGGRSSPLKVTYDDGGEQKTHEFGRDRESQRQSHRRRGSRDLSLWSTVLDGCTQKRSDFKGLPKSLQDKLNDRTEIMKEYLIKVLNVLNDSLVDQDVKYRILFIQRCCPNLLEACFRVWHTDFLATFDSHFSRSSLFEDKNMDNEWTTKITLGHWEFSNLDLDKTFEEPNSLEFPPKSIMAAQKQSVRGEGYRGILDRIGTISKTLVNILKREQGQNMASEGGDTHQGPGGAGILEGVISPPLSQKKFGQRSSSIAITGEKRGGLWTCLVLSSLIDEDTMTDYVEKLQGTLNIFTHQQSSGRCLAFLILLGHLCRHLHYEYENILGSLTEIVDIGGKVIEMGLDWLKSDEAVHKLERMIWGLEVLRTFDDSLSSSLSEIKEARDRMLHIIEQGPGGRQDTLDQEVTDVTEQFDKHHETLVETHNKIRQKIEENAKLRDGITAVTNLKDSRTSIKQNNTIRILTYITIAYLPLSFVASLFALSPRILPDSAGPGSFAWLIIVFVVGTLCAAFSIEPVLNYFGEIQMKRYSRRLGVEKNKTGGDGSPTSGHAAIGAPPEGIQNGDKSYGLGSSATSGQSPKQNGAVVTLPLVSAENSDEKVTRIPDVEKGNVKTKDPVTLRKKRPFWLFGRTKAS